MSFRMACLFGSGRSQKEEFEFGVGEAESQIPQVHEGKVRLHRRPSIDFGPILLRLGGFEPLLLRLSSPKCINEGQKSSLSPVFGLDFAAST